MNIKLNPIEWARNEQIKRMTKDELKKWAYHRLNFWCGFSKFLFIILIIFLVLTIITFNLINKSAMMSESVKPLVDEYCTQIGYGDGYNYNVYSSYYEIVCEKATIRGDLR